MRTQNLIVKKAESLNILSQSLNEIIAGDHVYHGIFRNLKNQMTKVICNVILSLVAVQKFTLQTVTVNRTRRIQNKQ